MGYTYWQKFTAEIGFKRSFIYVVILRRDVFNTKSTCRDEKVDKNTLRKEFTEDVMCFMLLWLLCCKLFIRTERAFSLGKL